VKTYRQCLGWLDDLQERRSAWSAHAAALASNYESLSFYQISPGLGRQHSLASACR